MCLWTYNLFLNASQTQGPNLVNNCLVLWNFFLSKSLQLIEVVSVHLTID